MVEGESSKDKLPSYDSLVVKESPVDIPDYPGMRLEEAKAHLLEKFIPPITIALVVVFCLGNLSCIALFFLTGFKVTEFSDVAIASLGAATIGEVAGLIGIIIKGITT